MPITVPALDDRDYRQLVAEALARIPVHNPEWTNFNDSDPGMTMVQLFAFLTESLLYRANQIPDRNRKKFLNLLGIGLKPAASAIGFVTIQNERGPLQETLVQAGMDLRAGALHFRVMSDLSVLPLEARAFIKAPLPEPATDAEVEERERFRLLYADLLDGPERQPAFYASMPLPPPAPGVPLPAVDLVNGTVDGCLWIALLARPTDLRQTPKERAEDLDKVRDTIGGKVLTLGVMPGATADGLDLLPGEGTSLDTEAHVVWEVAQPPADGMLPPAGANPDARKPKYAASLQPRGEGAGLRKPGLVELTLPAKPTVWRNLEPAEEGTDDFPPSLADTNVSDRVVTWLRIKAPRVGGTPPAVVSWVGINATMIEQRTVVPGESLGNGSGEPDQEVKLANTPVVAGSLRLTVGGELWTEVEDLLIALPEVPVGDPRQPLFTPEKPSAQTPAPLVNVYTCDRESGLVKFGNGVHGARPPAGQPIVASYSFGGGIAGNVAIGAVNRASDLPAGFKALNPLPTWGGSNAQTPAEAELTIPSEVKHKDRLVSVQDFHDITLRTPGVDIGRVEVLPLYDANEHLEGVPGAVTVVVIPRFDPVQPDAPVPDGFFLERICRYLEPRRLVTTELFIRGPLYRDLWVSVGIEVLGGYAQAPVIERVRRRLREFLSPLTGGRDGKGWPIGGNVLRREIEAIVDGVEGVRFVKQVLIGDDAGDAGDTFPVGAQELPRLVGIEVKQGDPTPLDELRGYTPSGPSVQVPIPVVPARC